MKRILNPDKMFHFVVSFENFCVIKYVLEIVGLTVLRGLVISSA